jgi:ATP/maltotriose-dependent transcriptional regulator MalT
MGRSAECMSYGELGRPDLAVAKAIESGRSLDEGEQGGFLRQPLKEFHAFALTSSGRIAEAVDLAERHWRSQLHEPKAAQFVASEILGMAELAAGDLKSALRHLPDFTREADPEVGSNFHAGNSIHRFALLRAQALARTGDVEEAQRVLDDAAARRHPAYVFVTSTELLAEAWVAAARLRITEARRFARQAADFARAHDQRAREVWCLQTAVQFDDVDAAERLGQLSTVVEGPRVEIAARYAAALHDDHGDGLDSTSVAFEMMGDLLAAADSAAQAASSHRRAGRAGSSMTAATRAHRLAVSCGGATSPAIAAAALPPAFTNREREIAVLIARGSSNREIAEAMSLSVRTVESHIYRACAKVGVAGRAGLGDVMRGAAG